MLRKLQKVANVTFIRRSIIIILLVYTSQQYLGIATA